MNIKLTNEITNHIFNYFNIFKENNIIKYDLSKFQSSKKIKLEFEDDVNIENNIYGLSTSISSIEAKAIFVDVGSGNNDQELILLFQLNKLTVYLLKLENDNISDKIYCLHNNKFVPISILLQAQLLSGFEKLSELPIVWNKLEDINDLYQYLIHFLNENNQ